MKKKKIFFLISLNLWSCYGLSMTAPPLDSLYEVFQSGTIDERLDTANEIAWELRYASKDSALWFARWAYDNYTQSGNMEGMATSLKRMGVVMKNMADYHGALENYKEALELELETKDMKGVASCYNNMGFLYEQIGIVDEAHRCYIASLSIKEKMIPGSKSLCNTYRNLGNFYANHRFELDTSIYYFNMAEEIAEELEDIRSLADIANDKGRVFKMMGDFTRAEGFMTKSLEACISTGDTHGKIMALMNIGLLMTETQEHLMADRYLEECLSLCHSVEDSVNMGRALVNLGYLRLSERDYSEAIDHYQRANVITQAKKMIKETKDTFWGLSEGYAALGDHAEAHMFLKRYDELEDSLYNIETNKTIARLRARYDTEKKEQKIAYLTTIHDQQAKALEQSKKIRNSIMLVSILVVIIVGLVAIYYRERQRSEKREALKNEEIHFLRMQELLNNEEKHVFEAAMDAQEEERKRIASMLHGEVGGILHMVRMYFSSLDEKISQKMDIEREQYEKASELLGKVTKEIREVSHSLDAGIVSNMGLLPALEELATSIERSGRMKVDINAFDMDKRFAVERELGVYRAVQEAVGNVLGHSGASKLQLTLTREVGTKEDGLTIIIEDNGKGFDLVKVRNGNGLGIRNIERLVKKLKGEVVFDSTPGRGATVIIKLKI